MSRYLGDESLTFLLIRSVISRIHPPVTRYYHCMDNVGNAVAWSYAAPLDCSESLATYLKFLKSKPKLSEIFFYLQSSFLLDYGFDAIALYRINASNEVHCVKSTGEDVLGAQGGSSLADIRKIIPPTLPTQSAAFTECIVSIDSKFIFFPFSQNTVVDAFLIHSTEKGIRPGARDQSALKFLALIQSLTAHHIVLGGLLQKEGHSDSVSRKDIVLSSRQKMILMGMIQEKTNHGIAAELGYSVSTIRHETMAIYKALGVSDRAEAARVGTQYNLV